jgi:hypothetical protein
MHSAGTILVVAALALVLAACGSGDDEATSTSDSSYTAVISASDGFAIGPTRFIFLLENARGQPETNADVHLKFYFIDPVRDNRKTIKNEIDATPLELDREYEVTAADGTAISMGPGRTGIYSIQIAFDQPGDWVVDMSGTAGNNSLGTIEATFSVAETSAFPHNGSRAPNIAGSPPEGPLMLVIGTPGVCLSSVCGPLVEIARDVAEEHSEIAAEDVEYQESDGNLALPAWTEEWGVSAEPAVFFIDKDGFVQGSLHTIATRKEVEDLIAAISP